MWIYEEYVEYFEFDEPEEYEVVIEVVYVPMPAPTVPRYRLPAPSETRLSPQQQRQRLPQALAQPSHQPSHQRKPDANVIDIVLGGLAVLGVVVGAIWFFGG